MSHRPHRPRFLVLLVLLFFPSQPAAHSQMSDPQSFSPHTCRVGGIPPFAKENCPGPCNFDSLERGRANFDGPDNVARVYRRGQTIKVKYQRNNHGPGGFTRLTLVPPSQMRSKNIHARNAFHYSCWGAWAVAAKPGELGKDPKKFSLVGNDGDAHKHAIGYYETTAKIPDCVPDGAYIFGWTWYGGTGTYVTVGAGQQEASKYGFFGDYWSCSWVRIRGGNPLRENCKAVFNNDMSRYSSAGCMSANDRPGVCWKEPCRSAIGKYQLPAPFKGGRTPDLQRSFYGSSSSGGGGGGTTGGGGGGGGTTGGGGGGSGGGAARFNACKCIEEGERCQRSTSNRTGGRCNPGVPVWRQKNACKAACCTQCRLNPRSSICNRAPARRVTRSLGTNCK